MLEQVWENSPKELQEGEEEKKKGGVWLDGQLGR